MSRKRSRGWKKAAGKHLSTAFGSGGGPATRLVGTGGFLFGLWAGGGQAVIEKMGDPPAALAQALYCGTGIWLDEKNGAYRGYNIWAPVRFWGFALIGRAIGRTVGSALDSLGIGRMIPSIGGS